MRSLSIAVTPDGRYAVLGGSQHDLVVLDLSGLAPHGDDADTDGLGLWAERLAGQRLHKGGGTVKLSAAEWLDRWRAWLLPSRARWKRRLGRSLALSRIPFRNRR
jgi:hypothetical protein